MGLRFRRSPQTRQHTSRRFYRPTVEGLEDRRLLAAPVINAIPVPLNLPVGKSLIVPITGSDPGGGGVTYSVTSSNPSVTVVSHPNTTFLDLTVAGFGDMEFELLGDVAPQTVALISGMVQSEFYNGLTFHRVVKGFAIQGGDPAGNGTGGPGFTFDDEFNPNAIFSGSGQLAMANSGKDTNGSQFFITDGAQRFLDFNHTIFGQLVRGFDVLQAIENVPVEAQSSTNPELSKPITPVVITSARIVQDTSDAVFTLEDSGTTTGTTTLTVTATSTTGGTTTQNFTVNIVPDTNAQNQPVNDPPILGPVSDQVSPTSTPITIHLTRTDLENDSSTFEAIPSDTTKVSVTVTPNADNSAADVVVTPLSGFTGSVQLTVGVEETGATSRGSTSAPFDTQVINVAFGDQPLTVVPVTGVSATEGAAGNGITVARFTDADLTAVPSDYKVSINWGDGTPLDTTSGQVTGSAGNFTVTGTHTYKEAGKFPVHVVVTDVHTSTTGGDNGGATATSDTTATVADAALSATGVDVSASANTALSSVVVANFTDADPNAVAGDFTATIDWGDGTTSAGTVTAGAAGSFTVTGDHTYAAAGSFTIGTTITDVNSSGLVAAATASAQSAASVTAPPAETSNELFVDRLYLVLLNRAATDADRANWAGLLDQGVSRATVSADISGSPEARTLQVNQLYQKYLGRAADPTGIAFGVNFLEQGGGTAGLTVDILSSSEYFTVRGGGTNLGFLQALYRDVLGRPLDVVGQIAAGSYILKGGSLRVVAEAVVFSLENYDTLAQDYAAIYLGHPPDPSLLLALASVPPPGRDMILAEAIASYLGSQEFFNMTQGQ